MLTKELFYQYRETAPLTTGQILRQLEQPLRVDIPAPKQRPNSQKIALIEQLKRVANVEDNAQNLSQFFEPKQAAQIDPLQLLERQKAIQAAKKRQPKGKVISHNA